MQRKEQRRKIRAFNKEIGKGKRLCIAQPIIFVISVLSFVPRTVQP